MSRGQPLTKAGASPLAPTSVGSQGCGSGVTMMLAVTTDILRMRELPGVRVTFVGD